MKIEDCPRFDRCSAPICPLDADWRHRAHLTGEPICVFLREAAKQGGKLGVTAEKRLITGDIRGDIPGENRFKVPTYLPSPDQQCVAQESGISAPLAVAVNNAWAGIRESFPDIHRRLDRAANSPSKLGKRPKKYRDTG